MDTLGSLFHGFAVALTPGNLLVVLLGTLVGTVIGVLPGLGPTASIALLLPITIGMDMLPALIMLAGIYYGAMYGGSTTSILVNIPGEAASVVTCIDGYQMARQGRAGPALGMSAFGSFIGGSVGVVAVMLISPVLAEAALKFGPAEMFALLFFAFTCIGGLTGTSKGRGLLMASVGLLLGSIGTDDIHGVDRFTFGSLYLRDGIGLVPLAMGLFGLGEILYNIEQREGTGAVMETPRNLLPTLRDWKDSTWPILRGSLLGFGIGVLPGGMPAVASLLSYAVERRVARRPEEFGKGAIAGVAGPETANNAATAGGFVPLLTLGIPTNSVLALMLAALMLHGVTPGPLLLLKWPDVFWGVIASMYIGNLMLLILNLPMIGLFVQLLKVPYGILSPLIIMFVLVGAYALNHSVADVCMTILFGIVGYLMKRYGLEPAPLVLAFVLGPMLENNLSKALILSRTGNPLFLFSRPISATLLTLAILVLAYPLVRWCLTRRVDREGSSSHPFPVGPGHSP
ncbi:MAG TPA: tripartite tricarboxylate transporter permease [Candidatus Methylomirabilis sp.]|nr:tripartite tricarboxylate transporter permease [Candidatus Methylomirabilis sp.]